MLLPQRFAVSWNCRLQNDAAILLNDNNPFNHLVCDQTIPLNLVDPIWLVDIWLDLSDTRRRAIQYIQCPPQPPGQRSIFPSFGSTLKNQSMTTRSKCRPSAPIRGYFPPYRVNHLEMTALLVHSPPILGEQKYRDKSTLCTKVVKSEIPGPTLTAHNDPSSP